MRWLCCSLLLGLAPLLLGGEILIVTARETRLEKLSWFQLQQIYLGKLDVLEGQTLKAMTLKPNDPLRKRFEEQIFQGMIDLSEYWIQQRLRGDSEPPIQVSNWSLMLLYAAHNPGYLAYIDAARKDQLEDHRLKIITITR